MPVNSFTDILLRAESVHSVATTENYRDCQASVLALLLGSINLVSIGLNWA